MTNEDIMRIAMEQSALEANCSPEDFYRSENIVTISTENKGARRNLELPAYCNLISYGSNIVASVNPGHCFGTPNIYLLNDAFRRDGMCICFMAEYFLPDVERLKERDCGCRVEMLRPEDLKELYVPEWSNALTSGCRELDVLAAGAYDGTRLVGLAGCSADCDTMWQIGIDVLPEYRRQGIASALTSRLALEILAAGRVPYYCAAWANVKSVKNAVQSGFIPAWVELNAKTISFSNALTGRKVPGE
ncbi:GNAT family N-acetyltransferase [Eisenbergiella massiliensis]|uniref:GNAT family N-acetyltransferase n=1 Tax=Eisenbergiella massiliensis TaxID=1720294 RepID=UPI0024925E1C|nr:GNAT family N-acetyltransferase [Eisenbergiella massiliensis]